MVQKTRIAVAAGLFCLSGITAAQTATGPKWDPHVDVEAKPGSKRNIGEADFFLPLWQDGKGLLFGNARLRVADHDNREGNLGLGYRRMLEGGWNIGGYGYYDRRRSTTGNHFNQVTLGAEALGRDWDFRGNVYLPQGDKVRDLGTTVMGGGAPTAAIVGTTVQVTTPGSTTFMAEERALKGFDLEAGWRAPIWAVEADKQLRLYAGGYHFSDGGVRVSGPRVRAELTVAELPALWKGAQLTLGAEYQDDNARGGQGFVSARLRIPLGSEPKAGYKTNWQERRMVAPVVRDVDVVTQARTFAIASTPARVETATAGGQPLVVLSNASTPDAAVAGAVAGAGPNSTVVFSGTFAPGPVTAQPGQTLMGAGTLTATTPSGQSFQVTFGGGTFTSGFVRIQADGVTVTGMTLQTGSLGIAVMNANNTTIANNSISVNTTGISGTGITVNAVATGVAITGNTIIVNAPNGAANGIGLGIVSDILIANNTFSTSALGQQIAINPGAPNILPGSTGNVLLAGNACQGGSTGTGTVFFTNGMTCP
jgi:hypothetical protein